MELAAAPLLLATASSAGGCFANVTVAGIVPAEPDFLFRLFGPDYTKSGHGLFSDVRACREVGRSALRLSRAQHLTQEVDVEQVARVSVLRMPVDAPMTVKLDCNHTLRQVRRRWCWRW